MSGATAASSGALALRRPRGSSPSAQRRWALWGSYAALAVFVAMLLTPPFLYDDDQLEDLGGDQRPTRQPVACASSHAAELLRADSQFQLSALLLELGDRDPLRGGHLHGDFHLRSVQPGANWVLGSQILATGVFLTYLFLGSLLFIPLFRIVRALGLVNNVWCLVLIYPTLAVPFCTWIMIGYFSSIPKELDEVALIDGATYVQILLYLHTGCDAGDHRGDDLRLHGQLGPVPVSDGLPIHEQPDGADGRHHHRADPRRCVPVGQDHGRLRPRRGAAGDRLRLPHGLLHCRAHGWGN